MVSVAPHVRASWGGTLGVPAREVWTNTINLMGVSGSATSAITDADLAGYLTPLSVILDGWFRAMDAVQPARGFSAIAGQAQLTWCKLNYIQGDGKYRGNPNTREFGPVGGPGTAPGTQTLPPVLWQQSTVISFRTAIARGRGSRGRIYPPMCGTAPANDGYMPSSISDGIQKNAVRLIGDLNKMITTLQGGDLTNQHFNCCIVSAARGGKAAMNTPITSLYVDRIPDVQRRRVNRLAPSASAPTGVYINT